MPNRAQPKPRLGSARGSLAKIGDMRQLQAALWEVIDKLKSEMATKGELIDVLPLKACHTLATLGGVYCRLHEIADIGPRLAAIEAVLADRPKPEPQPYPPWNRPALPAAEVEGEGAGEVI